MWGSRSIALAAAAVAGLGVGCSWLNVLDVCNEGTTEVRVNQRGDQSEFPGHPRAAAAALDTNRVWVAFVAQPLDLSSSQVRVASLNATTGERTIVCESEFEYTLSDPTALAYAATVAPVDLIVAGQAAKLAVAWMEGQLTTRARLVFLDNRGCPLGKPFAPFDASQASAGAALAWSPTKKALLVAFHDYQNTYVSWLTDNTPPSPTKLSTAFRIPELMAASIGEDGRGIVAWTSYADATAMTVGRPAVNLALVGADGGIAPAFLSEFPGQFDSQGTADITVASGKNRHAVAISLGVSELARQVVYATEVSADDGKTVTAPYRVDAGTGAAHFYPSLAYGDDDTLVVAWQTADRKGTVARLFDRNGEPRFNAVGCDDKVFAVGARANEGMQGTPSALFTAGNLWVLHSGQPGYDSVAMGTVGWRMEWQRLWPAR